MTALEMRGMFCRLFQATQNRRRWAEACRACRGSEDREDTTVALVRYMQAMRAHTQ